MDTTPTEALAAAEAGRGIVKLTGPQSVADPRPAAEPQAPRHVSPAIREHLVEQVVETAKHLRALSLNGVEADSDIYLDTLAQLGDVTQRLSDFDQAVAS